MIETPTADSSGAVQTPRSLPTNAIIMALASVVLLGAFLRIWRLDESPPAINQDEAVHAYDAWCLLKTGRDHDGAAWPIFFRAFGDYHPAPFVYLLIPFQAVMGLGVWSARLPAALMGTLAIPLVFLLLHRRYGSAAALTAAGLTALSPWHLHLNRLALEAGICPTLVLAGLVLLDAARPALVDRSGAARLRQLLLLVLSGVIFGLAAWTYHAMRVFVPLLLIGLLLSHAQAARELLRSPNGRMSGMVWAGGLLFGLMPFLAASILAPQQAWARATTVTAIDAEAGMLATVRDVAVGYLNHFTTAFLFRQGDPSPVQSVPGYGQLHLFHALLVPLGLWRLLRGWRSDRFGRFLLWWMAAAPAPSALADWPGGHSLRSVGSLPVYEIIGALGLCAAISWAAARGRQLAVALAAACALGIALNAGFFLRRFFVEYPNQAAPYFQTEWKDVFAVSRPLEAGYDIVLYSPLPLLTYQHGMLYLFWTKMDPVALQAAEVVREPIGIVDRIVRIDRVVFEPSADLAALIAAHPEVEGRVLVAERPGVAVLGEALQRFHYPDGSEAVVLYDVRVGGPSRETGAASVLEE